MDVDLFGRGDDDTLVSMPGDEYANGGSGDDNCGGAERVRNGGSRIEPATAPAGVSTPR